MASSSSPTATPQLSRAELDAQKMMREYSNETTFSLINTVSSIRPDDLPGIRELYHIPSTYEMRAPLHGDRMYHRPNKWTAISLYTLKNGVCLPLHPFIVSLLGFTGFGLGQLVPNSFIHLIAFIAFCHEAGVEPTTDLFYVLFVTSRSREAGFRQINKQPSKGIEKRPLMKTPSSNKGWHSQWFFIRGPTINQLPGWAEHSQPTPVLGELPEARVIELRRIVDMLPQKEWDIELLGDQNWLYTHKCKSLDSCLGSKIV